MEAALVASSASSHTLSYVQELDPNDIPTPFPRDLVPSRSSARSSIRSAHSAAPHAQIQLIGQQTPADTVTRDRPLTGEPLNADHSVARSATHGAEPAVQSELRPSLDDLRDLCLTALLNLFPATPAQSDLKSSAASASSRRHSAPVSPGASASVPQITTTDAAEPPAVSLDQLLLNLRELDPASTPYLGQSPAHELARRLPAAVQATLRGLEADLAMALSSLLVNIERLPQADEQQTSSRPRSRPSTSRSSRPATAQSTASDQNLYESLGRQVLDVKAKRLQQSASSHEGSPASMVSLQLWDEINHDMETVLRLCRARTPGHVGPQASPLTPDLVSLEAPAQNNYFDHLPPEYDYQDYPQDLPMYEYGDSLQKEAREAEKKKSAEVEREAEPRISSEKMRIDLEAITSAIDRLYEVAPQLHNQRVELDGKKLRQMENARKSGAKLRNTMSASELAIESEASKLLGRGRMTDQTATPSKRFSTEVLRQKLDIKGKGKAREDTESLESMKTKSEDLDRILHLIDRSSGDQRRISAQRVDYGDFQYRVEKAKQKDQKKKEQLVEQIIRHSTTGRLSTQDAVFHREPIRKSMVAQQEVQQPEALLSLPEFIRESVPPASVSRTMNPNALLTLPEFFREQVEHEERLDAQFSQPRASVSGATPMRSSETTPPHTRPVSLIRKIARTRSNSAPPLSLAWFKSGAAITARYSDVIKPILEPPAAKKVMSGPVSRNASFEETIQVFYVAEYHQNLHSVQVYLRTVVATPGFGVEMEVLPSDDGALTGSDQFIIRSRDVRSPPLPLPVPVTVGPHNLKVFGEHFEIKLDIPPLAQIAAVDPSEIPRLLDATQIEDMQPATFICSSCSLPVVQCSKISDYRDLPSEHWAELVDAWMCHPDQKLNQNIVQNGNGVFAPSGGQALVGGSYILFDESAVVKDTLIPPTGSNDGDRATVRCRCGAIIGRSMKTAAEEGLTYRLAKYALRPVSPTLEPVRIPLSAYVVADMVELQQAHATHRFVVTDEEDDKPRMLIWLFNPTVRMSYMSATHYALPEQSTLLAAKVFYTLIGPSSPLALNPAKINEQYPAFKSAETISYPMAVCRRLAAMLKESTELYPPIRKSMMSLDVGWLQRG